MFGQDLRRIEIGHDSTGISRVAVRFARQSQSRYDH